MLIDSFGIDAAQLHSDFGERESLRSVQDFFRIVVPEIVRHPVQCVAQGVFVAGFHQVLRVSQRWRKFLESCLK